MASIQEDANAIERDDTTIESPTKDVILRNKPEEEPYSIETIERSSAAKIFFEQYFDSLARNPSQRYKRRLAFEQELEKMSITESEKQVIRQSWLKQESGNMRRMRQKLSLESFDIVKTIGKG